MSIHGMRTIGNYGARDSKGLEEVRVTVYPRAEDEASSPQATPGKAPGGIALCSYGKDFSCPQA